MADMAVNTYNLSTSEVKAEEGNKLRLDWDTYKYSRSSWAAQWDPVSISKAHTQSHKTIYSFYERLKMCLQGQCCKSYLIKSLAWFSPWSAVLWVKEE